MKIEVVYDGVPAIGLIPEDRQDVALLRRLNEPNNLRVTFNIFPGSGMWLAPMLVRDGEFPMPAESSQEEAI